MASEEEFEAARQRVEDLLRELTPLIGPVKDHEGGEVPRGSEHVASALLSEWVMIGSWIDPIDGEPFVVRLCSSQLPGHHRDGLIFQALYRMEDD